MRVTAVKNLVPVINGQGVSITSHLVRYGSSTSGTVKPTSWENTIPTVSQGNFLWTWTHVEYSDGNKTDVYSVSRMGIDGKGVKSATVKYSMQATSVNPSDINDWGDYPSQLTDGYWLYTRTIMVYSDSQSTTSYSVSQIGTGSYYAGCVEYYCASASSSSPATAAPAAGTYASGETISIDDKWSQSRPTLNQNTPYLWNFEISSDSRGNRYVTPAICIGNFAKGIASITECYAISAYSYPYKKDKAEGETVYYPEDITEWTDEQTDAAPTTAKPYQWNRTKTTYNDNSSEYHYHVSAVKGPKGNDAHSPKVGSNGNWWFWNDAKGEYVDSGTSAKGDDGKSPYVGSNGNWFQYDPTTKGFVDTNVKAEGLAGSTPTIGSNGNWWVGTTDTGVTASGTPGNSPYIGQNGHWWVGTTDTNVKATGNNGYTPYIGDNGNWWIDGQDTGDKAIGDNGKSPYIDATTGTWWYYDETQSKYVDSGIKPKGSNGADGAQLNLFGYGSALQVATNGFYCIAHTKTGFAAFIEANTSDYTFVNIYYGDMGQKYFPIGIYALSCKVKFTNVSGLPSSFSCFATFQEGSSIGGSTQLLKSDGTEATGNVQAGVEYHFALKFNLTSQYFPYFAISKMQNTGVFFKMEVYDLKIEKAESLTGVSTSFYGLAEDKRPAMPNMLRNTQKIDVSEKWSAYSGSVVTNAISGCNAFSGSCSSGYKDLLKQLLAGGVLKPSTWYTLSYYAKSSGTVASYCYPSVNGINKDACDVSVSQETSYYPWTQDGEWWVSGAKGVNSGVSIIKVTLTNNTSSAATQLISVSGSSEANWDFFYISESQLTSFSDVKNSSSCIYKCSGSSSDHSVSVVVNANSSKEIYIGYCKDGSSNSNLDQYKIKFSGSHIDTIMIVDGSMMDATTDCYHSIEASTEWVRHTVSFFTSSNISGAKEVLWRVFAGGSLQVAMMKLEEGDAATPWAPNTEDSRGNSTGFNILSWTDCIASGSWRFYDKNEITSELAIADIVIYNSYYYICILGYTASSNSSTPDIDSTHWKVFQSFANVATDILISEAIKTKILEAVNARITNLILNNAYAKNASNITTLSIDGSTGKLTAKGAEIDGVVKADVIYTKVLNINDEVQYGGTYTLDMSSHPYCEFYGSGDRVIQLPAITDAMQGMEISISNWAVSRTESSLNVKTSSNQRIQAYSDDNVYGLLGTKLTLLGNNVKLKAFTSGIYSNGIWRIVSSCKTITSTALYIE